MIGPILKILLKSVSRNSYISHVQNVLQQNRLQVLLKVLLKVIKIQNKTFWGSLACIENVQNLLKIKFGDGYIITILFAALQ